MKNLYSLILVLLFSVSAPAQNGAPAQNNSCPPAQVLERNLDRCIDARSELIIALGVIRPDHSGEEYILDDDKRGPMQLVLSRSLIQEVRESPAESYEAEGYLTHSRQGSEMIVTSLRPIE